MVVLRIRNSHKRKCVLVCFSIVGVLLYRYLGTPARDRGISRKVGLNSSLSQFTLAGEPFRILGGSIHYFRVPRAYWRDRLMKMKACGINTLTTFVPWSLHQPEREVFNFHTQLDLETYINLAAELELWVILRVGPYIGSELDLGGLPSWLLRDGGVRLRTTHPVFTEAVDRFFDKLIPKIVPLQFKKGGPVIAVQLENEYGSFAKDDSYMLFIKEALWSRGIGELLLTSDVNNGLQSGGVNGGCISRKYTVRDSVVSSVLALRALKLQKLHLKDIQSLHSLQPHRPSVVMDYWTGSLDVWGDLHHVLPPEDMVSTVREILRRGMSINLYMFHGGTSFGFMSGAVADPTYKALIPSYDFDAPLSECGDYTPKYHLLRDLFGRYNSESYPDMPPLRYKEAYEPAVMYLYLSLWDVLSFTEEPFTSPIPVNMENLPVNNNNGQSYGYALYETTITRGGLLKSGDNVRDRALVFVDKHYIGLFKRQNLELAVPDGKGERTLSLLVENCGRVHHGQYIDNQRKGLVGHIMLNNTPLRHFTIYSLDMKPSFINSLNQAPWKVLPQVPSFPGFFMGRMFAYGYPSDTFVKLTGWGKGVFFINEFNLGRYWNIGPQQSLYLPAPFLNSGVNQIVVFEEQEAEYKIHFEDIPDLGMTADL